jgi:hypothetical protein
MLRHILKQKLSADDYAKLNWVYAGATNLRYEQLVARTLNATLLNEPFISELPASISCQPFWKLTGPIQGTVGNIRASSLDDPDTRAKLEAFLRGFKELVHSVQTNSEVGKTGLEDLYKVNDTVADSIYQGLWGVDGLSTTFCFEDERLKNVEVIFSEDSGIAVPGDRWWVKNLGCNSQ